MACFCAFSQGNKEKLNRIYDRSEVAEGRWANKINNFLFSFWGLFVDKSLYISPDNMPLVIYLLSLFAFVRFTSIFRFNFGKIIVCKHAGCWWRHFVIKTSFCLENKNFGEVFQHFFKVLLTLDICIWLTNIHSCRLENIHQKKKANWNLFTYEMHKHSLHMSTSWT